MRVRRELARVFRAGRRGRVAVCSSVRDSACSAALVSTAALLSVAEEGPPEVITPKRSGAEALRALVPAQPACQWRQRYRRNGPAGAAGSAGARKLRCVSAWETVDVSAHAWMLRAARGGHDTDKAITGTS